jgi:hypothetical protein
MRFRPSHRAIALLLLPAAFAGWSVLNAQKPFMEYPGAEYTNFPLPADYLEKTEWTRARLKCPSIRGGFRGDTNWTIDYPRSDRHLLQGVRRLTRINTRSVEQITEADGSDDMYNWPTLYAVEVGHWDLPEDQAAQLREFLLRGGFLMVDDFHGSEEYRGLNEWATFVASIKRVFPDREIVDIKDDDPIFHTIYDLSDRFQVPGAQYLRTGITYEKGETGRPAHWRAIYDDKGRIMVAISLNSDIGDSWEFLDDPRYPVKYSALGTKIGVNYVIYAMTH